MQLVSPRKVLGMAVAAALMTAVLVSPAVAATIYGTSAIAELTGCRSVSSGGTCTDLGVTANGIWNTNDFTISWTITAVTGGFNYSYTLDTNSGSAGNISHFVLDISNDCTETSGCIQNANGTIEFGNFDGIDGAVKFDFGCTTEECTYTFFSPRVPVYGDFFTKDGQSGDVALCGVTANQAGKIELAACNSGFGIHGDAGTLTNIAYIPVPDTVTSTTGTGSATTGTGSATTGTGSQTTGTGFSVPEPASLLLLGAGLLGLGVAGGIGGRRRK